MSNRVVTSFLLIIVLLQTTSESWIIRSCTSKNSAVYVSNPLGDSGTPSIKDYIDLKMENQLNTVLNKIFDKIDSSAIALKKEIKEDIKEIKEDIKELKKDINDSKEKVSKDIDELKKENNDIKNKIDVGINTVTAVGVVLGAFGIANISNFISAFKSLFGL